MFLVKWCIATGIDNPPAAAIFNATPPSPFHPEPEGVHYIVTLPLIPGSVEQ